MKFSAALFCSISFVAFASPAWAGTKDQARQRDLVAAISDCQDLLQQAPVPSRRIGGDNAVLCVWQAGAPTPKLVTVVGGKSRTRGFTVEMLRRNGVNSHYHVSPDGWLVVGLKTSVNGRSGSAKACWSKTKRGKRHQVECPARSVPAIYVPWCEKLESPEMIRAGRVYLEALLKRAAQTLNRPGVHSKLDGKSLVTETVPWRVLLTLLVVEHMDPENFRAQGVAAVVNQVLTTIAVNQGDSYGHAISRAKAGGLAQFIKPTYDEVRGSYGAAHLKPEFIEGMRDHLNAVRAQFCLADRDLAKLAEAAPKAHLKLVQGDERELGAWIAASYNGGPHRAIPALRDSPEAWDKPGHGLVRETTVYVEEFRAVYRYLFGQQPMEE
jgi:hypothetical protein